MAARARVRGAHHYGIVLALMTVTLIFSIAAPDADLSRGIGIGLQGLTLLVVLLTSDSPHLRHSGVPLAILTVASAVLAAAGMLSDGLSHAIWGLLALAALAEVAAGNVRLIRSSGVTLQVVMGGLTIYLLMGIVFALVLGVGAALTDGPWFAQGTDGTLAIRIYYSFATLTTTGYGDYTPATGVGRAMSVSEMLTGQLYLVTVIGVLVGGVARRRSS